MNPISRKIIKHFQHGDRFNQLRPGETYLAIQAFKQGFWAAMLLVDSLKVTDKEYCQIQDEVDEWFQQFVDEPTLTEELV
jgi:hypothetical protein